MTDSCAGVHPDPEIAARCPLGRKAREEERLERLRAEMEAAAVLRRAQDRAANEERRAARLQTLANRGLVTKP